MLDPTGVFFSVARAEVKAPIEFYESMIPAGNIEQAKKEFEILDGFLIGNGRIGWFNGLSVRQNTLTRRGVISPHQRPPGSDA